MRKREKKPVKGETNEEAVKGQTTRYDPMITTKGKKS